MSSKVNSLNGYRLAFLLIIILGLLCVFWKLKNDEVVQTLESSYSRAFFELVDYLDNVETLLAKAQISGSSEFAAKNFTDIWRKADLAQSSLSQIPITHVTLENAMKFLNQLSDYSYSLSRKAIENEGLSEEDLNNIRDFYDKCKTLNETFRSLANDMNSGSLSWSELTESSKPNELAQEVSNVSQESFSQIEENMQDYEGLIYDGPFSEHMTSTEPLGLSDEVFSREMAEEKVYEYIDKDKIREIKYNGIVESTIRVHSFDIELDDGSFFYIDVTENGGEVLWFMHKRDIGEEKLIFEEAKAKALEFLDKHGFKSMKETYYISENAMVTINFAYLDGDVVCYPDLLKVKVALDDGSIIGLEAQSYFSSHHERNIEMPSISIEEAREKLNSNIEIFSEGMAIIPTDWKTELLTYEFKGRVDENDFIVYVNTMTGKEEKIFMIVETPNGVLTV